MDALDDWSCPFKGSLYLPTTVRDGGVVGEEGDEWIPLQLEEGRTRTKEESGGGRTL